MLCFSIATVNTASKGPVVRTRLPNNEKNMGGSCSMLRISESA